VNDQETLSKNEKHACWLYITIEHHPFVDKNEGELREVYKAIKLSQD